MKKFTTLMKSFVSMGLIVTCVLTANNLYKDSSLLSLGYSYASVNNIYNELTSVKLYPSPATDKINIEYPSKDSKCEIKVFSVTGECVFSSKDRVNMIDVSSYAAGYYFVQFINAEDQSIVKKVQKVD
jgi:hypothetical protein